MKEKALIYSKCFKSPPWVWTVDVSGASEEGSRAWWWRQGWNIKGVNKVHMQHIR